MQKRYIKYQDNLVSFDTNASKAGIIPGAVYRGFDNVNGGADLNLTISHQTTGLIMPDLNEDDTNPLGIWVDRQGATITEDEEIPLAIQTNAGNNSVRKDYVVGYHHHDVIAIGGIAANYAIIRGPLNSLDLPADPEGNDWVIIGILYIPALASTTAGVKYTRSRVPSLGNKFPALLEEPNRFEEQNQEFQAGVKIISSATIDTKPDRNSLADIDGGNLMTVQGTNKLDLIPNKPNGTEIQLYFQQDTTLRPFISQLNGAVTAGYSKDLRAIVINYDGTDNLIIKANQIATFRKYDKGGAYANDNKVFGEFWKLINVSDTPDVIRQQNQILTDLTTSLGNINTTITNLAAKIEGLDAPGNIRSITIRGNILDLFTTTGRGKPNSPYPEHQICNGAIAGVPDLRDAKLAGYAGAIDAYNPDAQAVGGINDVELDETHIPQHRHGMFGDQAPGGPISINVDPTRTVAHKVGIGSNYDYDLRCAYINTDGYLGRTGPSGTAPEDQESIDVRGKKYPVIFIMRLTAAQIAANPYVG